MPFSFSTEKATVLLENITVTFSPPPLLLPRLTLHHHHHRHPPVQSKNSENPLNVNFKPRFRALPPDQMQQKLSQSRARQQSFVVVWPQVRLPHPDLEEEEEMCG
jgi:hypothetical protein